jgi:hypothetical protein
MLQAAFVPPRDLRGPFLMSKVVQEITELRKKVSSQETETSGEDGFATPHPRSCPKWGIPAAGSYSSTDAHSGFAALFCPFDFVTRQRVTE